MSTNYAYNFAYVDFNTNMCIEVFTCTDPNEGNRTDVIVVPLEVYDGNYLFKYYNQENGQWYTDPEFTNPWKSALL